MKNQTEIGRTFFALVLALLTFVIVFLLLKWSIFLALPLAGVVYAGIYLLSKPIPKIGNIEAELLKDGEEAKELLDNAKEKLREIGRRLSQIREPDYRQLVVDASKTATSLVQYLEQNPAKIFKAQKFLTYQLDLALDSVKDYQEVKSVEIDNESMKDFDRQSRNIMKILQDSYEKQFEALVQDKIMNMDVQNEILESKIKAEKGLSQYEE